MAAVEVAHISEIPSPVAPEAGSYEWKPVRQHFGIASFGVNANIAASAGDIVVEEHTEVDESETQHEELYFVATGHARFDVGGQRVEAPAGTFVYVRDPAVSRSARALETGTTVVAIGGEPGVPFSVSPWEKKYFGE